MANYMQYCIEHIEELMDLTSFGDALKKDSK